MKFCRFELVTDPEKIRTGIAYEGRIYETDGTNAIGIHEAGDIRLLAPIGRPPTVRVFREGDHAFDYAHPGAMLGPNLALPLPSEVERVAYVPALAVVIGGAGSAVVPSVADDLVLGLALAHVFSTLRDPGGRALDLGYCVGPAIVTPDEFGADSIRPDAGAFYADSVAVWRNGVEITSFDLASLRPSPASAIAYASETQPLAEGDLILIPLGELDLVPEAGDQLKLVAPKLGALLVDLVKR